MKIDHLSFPHPVLNLRDDVAGNYQVTHSVQKSREEIVISVMHELVQSSLERLIANHDACFLVEVHCPQTLFRVAYSSFDPEQTIIIPSHLLRDFVEVSFFIIATSSIFPYEISGANEDYADAKMEVSRGDVLGYGGRDNFSAEKRWEAQKSVSSFMEVRPYSDLNGPVKYILSDQKIIVRMPAGDYKSYRKLVGHDQFAPIFHASIVLPALMFALTQMMSDKEQYEGLNWYKVIESRRNMDEKLKSLAWEPANVPEIAQMILSNPVERSLWGMRKVVDQFISSNDQ